ncbi:MAG: (d)CMP kinase [Defluviicoccus sp.]
MTGRKTPIIAVDGPAGAGKGTVARRLAARLGYAYLDTGLLYRAVGMKVVAQGGNPSSADDAAPAAHALTLADLDRADLRSDAAAVAASKVAAIPAVRAALLAFQRAFAATPPDGAAGAVLDGRDIGTVVSPDADLKIFLTASLDVRVARRLEELRQRGLPAIHSRVLHDMQERDRRDATRSVAPLVAAKGAFVIDTSDLDRDAVYDRVLGLAGGIPGRGSEKDDR